MLMLFVAGVFKIHGRKPMKPMLSCPAAGDHYLTINNGQMTGIVSQRLTVQTVEVCVKWSYK